MSSTERNPYAVYTQDHTNFEARRAAEQREKRASREAWDRLNQQQVMRDQEADRQRCAEAERTRRVAEAREVQRARTEVNTPRRRGPSHAARGDNRGKAEAKKLRRKQRSEKVFRRGGKRNWSWIAALIGFMFSAGVAQSSLGLTNPAIAVVGGIGAVVCGMYYKQILVTGIAVAVVGAIVRASAHNWASLAR